MVQRSSLVPHVNQNWYAHVKTTLSLSKIQMDELQKHLPRILLLWELKLSKETKIIFAIRL